MIHSLIVYRPGDRHRRAEFFNITVATANPPLVPKIATDPLRITVCFCGKRTTSGFCKHCGYETERHRAMRVLQTDPEDLRIGRQLDASLRKPSY